jgi:hypothetical protein
MPQQPVRHAESGEGHCSFPVREPVVVGGNERRNDDLWPRFLARVFVTGAVVYSGFPAPIHLEAR